jgi:hypothetical protein
MMIMMMMVVVVNGALKVYHIHLLLLLLPKIVHLQDFEFFVPNPILSPLMIEASLISLWLMS